MPAMISTFVGQYIVPEIIMIDDIIEILRPIYANDGELPLVIPLKQLKLHFLPSYQGTVKSQTIFSYLSVYVNFIVFS